MRIMARARTNVNTYGFQSVTMVRVTKRTPKDTPFARGLRTLIEREGWANHREAGAAIGVSHTQIGRYLAGARPGIDRAEKVASLLGVRLDELLEAAPPSGRSLELAKLADQIREASDQQARIARILQAVALDVERLGAQAHGGSGTG